MKRISILLLTVAFVAVVVHSQTVNFSSVKVKTKTEKEKLDYTFPYDQFVMLDYGAVKTYDFWLGHNLGLRYGQVHIGGWYVSADVSLSKMHFSHDGSNDNNAKVFVENENVSFNRISFGAGGIVRLVIPLYFYLGAGYFYQNTTMLKNHLWQESTNSRLSPHSSGYIEFGIQGKIKGLTPRFGFKYGFPHNYELSVGLGWTFGRKSKNQ